MNRSSPKKVLLAGDGVLRVVAIDAADQSVSRGNIGIDLRTIARGSDQFSILIQAKRAELS
jgi:hypothetical protein